jgi:hypothetical protein
MGYQKSRIPPHSNVSFPNKYSSGIGARMNPATGGKTLKGGLKR